MECNGPPFVYSPPLKAFCLEQRTEKRRNGRRRNVVKKYLQRNLELKSNLISDITFEDSIALNPNRRQHN
ncbi:CLUMA_CG005186, isoform A [Clunio marinus]|uniref:CLUMA_CG005186, isoform A n=1 Tax=Clunio marinus TaxID=568069 RepID=A0A1J1HU46_9DIPT|nr:CLUMA_CG005186, isoform A [Clunio marinus]